MDFRNRFARVGWNIVCCVMAVLLFSSFSTGNSGSSTYNVAAVYEGQEIKGDAKAIKRNGSVVEDVKTVLFKTELNVGRYDVKVTKIDTDLYHVEGTDLYIETRYCFQYAYRQEALLNITSRYGYNIGELIFF